MNKDKLVSLVIKKQTYREANKFLEDLTKGKENVPKICAEAVRDILTTQYIAEAKLFAVRFLKDAFEKGSPSFIHLVQTSLLPILLAIALDQKDERAVTRYAGTSYTKSEELKKFKSILQSLFRIAQECIIKWGEWISDSSHKFVGAAQELKRQGLGSQAEFKYFRVENQQLFIQNCAKNKFYPVRRANPLPAETNKRGPSAEGEKGQSMSQKQSKNPLAVSVEDAMTNFKNSASKEEYNLRQQLFNEVLDRYLQGADDFDQTLVTKWFQTFEEAKNKFAFRLQNKKIDKSNVADTPEAPKLDHRSPQQGTLHIIEGNSHIRGNKGTPEATTFKKKIPPIPSLSKGSQDEHVEHLNAPLTQVNQKSMKAVTSPKQRGRGPIIFEDEPFNVSSKSKEVKQNSETEPNKAQAQNQKIHTVKGEVKHSAIKILSSEDEVRRESKRGSETQGKQPLTIGNESPTLKSGVEDRYKVFSPLEQSVSKQSERVDFSEEESEYSQDASLRQPEGRLQKNNKLPQIEEEHYSPEENNSQVIPKIQSKVESRKMASEVKQILEQKTVLQKGLRRVARQLEEIKEDSRRLQQEKSLVMKQLKESRQNQQSLLRRLKASVSSEDYSKFAEQFQRERQMCVSLRKQKEVLDDNVAWLQEDNCRLRKEHKCAVLQCQRMKEKEKSMPMGLSTGKVVSGLQERSRLSKKGSSLGRQQLDDDYVRNLTHPSNIHLCLNQANMLLLKKSALSLSEVFYRDDYVTILSRGSVYTQNNRQFMSAQLRFQLQSPKFTPHTSYKNCQELELWIKELSGSQKLYNQEVVIRLHRNPSRILKGSVQLSKGLSVPFLLPFMYFNFLRHEQFSQEQFQQIYINKADQLIKSRIVQLNGSVLREQELGKAFGSELSGGRLRFCLAEGVEGSVFLGQFQLFRNSKVHLKMLPIPNSEEMMEKTRELMDNILFLIS